MSLWDIIVWPFARLLEMRVFQRIVTITVEDGRRVYRVEAL